VTVNEDVVVVRKDGLIEAEVDGEMVALHVENGTCYGFNGTATRVWALLADNSTVGEICAHLTEEYEVDREQCAEQVMELLREFEKDGLVEIKPAS
jgi:hypothetical protein